MKRELKVKNPVKRLAFLEVARDIPMKRELKDAEIGGLNRLG